MPESDVSAMMLHAFDHFDLDIYEKHYNGHPDRIRSYLLMKRKYIYLIIATTFEADKADPSRDAADKWLEELSKFQEFRDVHASQRKYYSTFSEKVDAIIETTPMEGWALSSKYLDFIDLVKNSA